jgi:hypothetical protein
LRPRHMPRQTNVIHSNPNRADPRPIHCQSAPAICPINSESLTTDTRLSSGRWIAHRRVNRPRRAGVSLIHVFVRWSAKPTNKTPPSSSDRFQTFRASDSSMSLRSNCGTWGIIFLRFRCWEFRSRAACVPRCGRCRGLPHLGYTTGGGGCHSVGPGLHRAVRGEGRRWEGVYVFRIVPSRRFEIYAPIVRPPSTVGFEASPRRRTFEGRVIAVMVQMNISFSETAKGRLRRNRRHITDGVVAQPRVIRM